MPSAALAPAPGCFHCGLPLPLGSDVAAVIRESPRAFCCTGCRAVCEAIHAASLEGFYRRTQEGEPLGPPPELPSDLSLYDLDAVQEEFVDTTVAEREINLLVEGIHCAACVWLIETGLKTLPGVGEARVNLTGRRLRVRWDNARLPLSRILRRLGDLGYAAVPFDPESAEGALRRAGRAQLYRLAWAGFAMMNLLWVSIALYSGADQGEFLGLFQWTGCLLATPTLIYAGYPFYKGAWNGLRSGHLSMDLPIAIGASITYLYSLYVTVSGTRAGEVYWDTVVNFLFVILLGRFLEGLSRREAVAATARLLDLQPKVATVLREDTQTVVAIRSIVAGERVLVRAGERVPVDGTVLEGVSEVDESMLSGESRPVPKAVGEGVCAGTINGAGVLTVRATATLRDTALGQIIRLVEDAQASRAPIQRLTDRIVPWFVALTLGLGVLTFVAWVGVDLQTAILAGTAVLIVTCPCALGMATPMAVAVAAGLGASRGILIKNGAVLERLSSIDHVVFDKTGTLTTGRPAVTGWRRGAAPWQTVTSAPPALDAQEREQLRRVGALERRSEHPAAVAVLALCEQLGIATLGARVESVEVVPGLGIRGQVDGALVVVGSADWLERHGVEAAASAGAAAASPGEPDGGLIHCVVAGHPPLVLATEDRLRPEAAAVVRRMRAQGIRVTLLTGDRRAVAERIAADLGDVQVIADVRPEAKDQVIAELQRCGQRVAMVGDGVNDAPALVRADVGIAMGSGTDVSIASADIVLMSNDLERVAQAAELSRRTLRTIRQNIGISVVYNLIMVPLAMAAVLTPLIAAIAMPLSSLAVIGNSARIRRLFTGRAEAAAIPNGGSRWKSSTP
ncbi:heavy metal translocating P-type ATPase [uncultured Thiodictyon sp.]|uniref:heavy metal translocating P-type ATPase n=1 Tax=uncultured Thiodictyon sp. TaxID=1846217 RepID=UPI0025DC66DB|nr:heavy metal translocating P-type ATPase [uncultured Thiodictyon sp.]